MKDITLIESAVRLALWLGFEGAVTLVRVMDCGETCVVEHADGMRGVVPVHSIIPGAV